KTNLNTHYSQLSFINDYHLNDSVILANYKNEILLKNMSLKNQQGIKNSIKTTGDLSLTHTYENYILNKRLLVKQELLPTDGRDKEYESLIEKTEQLEKEITRLSAAFSESQSKLSVNYEEIVKHLTSDEAIIDLVAFQYYNKRWTDSTYYSAFVIRNSNEFPEYAPLFEEKQIDSILSNKDNVSTQKFIDNQYENL